MTLDGQPQLIRKVLVNDRPTSHDVVCQCGGQFYAAPSSRYVRCSGGEIRCTVCHRQARRFGKGFTCGIGCPPDG